MRVRINWLNPNQLLWAFIVTAPFAFADNSLAKRVAIVTAISDSACLREIDGCFPLRAGAFIENNALIEIAAGSVTLYDFTRHSRVQMAAGQHRITAETVVEETTSAVQRRLQRLLSLDHTASASRLERGDVLPAQCSVETLFTNRPAWLESCSSQHPPDSAPLAMQMPHYSYYREWPTFRGPVAVATATVCGAVQSLNDLSLPEGEPVYILARSEGQEVAIGLAKLPQSCLNGLDGELAVLDTLSSHHIPFEENLARASLLEALGLRYEAAQSLQMK